MFVAYHIMKEHPQRRRGGVRFTRERRRYPGEPTAVMRADPMLVIEPDDPDVPMADGYESEEKPKKKTSVRRRRSVSVTGPNETDGS